MLALLPYFWPIPGWFLLFFSRFWWGFELILINPSLLGQFPAVSTVLFDFGDS